MPTSSDLGSYAAQRTVYAPRIDALPYTDVLVVPGPGSAAAELSDEAGSRFVERETERAGRIALLPLSPGAMPLVPASAEGAARAEGASGEIGGREPTGGAEPEGESAPWLLVVECEDWSVQCPMSSGQLHRLTNALEGRGTRPGIRPVATDGEFVHLGGSPELLIVEHGDQRVEIPAGPRRALGKALRAAARA